MADRPSPQVPRWLNTAAALGWRLLIVGAALYIVFLAFGRLRLVVMPVLFALFLTAILAPPANWLRKHRWPPALATFAVFVVALAVLVGLGFWFVPKVVNQFGDVGKQASQGFKDVQHWLTHAPFHLKQADIDRYINEAKNQINQRQGQIAQGALTGVGLLVEILTTAFLTIVITFFFVKDGDKIGAWMVGLFAEERSEEVREIGRRSWEALGGYIRGTAINGVVNGTVMGVTLAVLGVPLALPLAVLTFLGAFVPLVGAIITGVLAALIALVAKGGVAAVVVIGATIVIHNLEGYLVGPFVLGRAVHLHPVAVLLALTTGTILAGILGAILAVPVLSILLAIIAYYRGDNPELVEAAATADEDRPEPLRTAG
ncbi:MAG TPA: AI-2E family transporter [Acidimicrobiales bacterium]|nr:AI-2E family transporter [Acidimicrobiales bacterium]